MKHSLFWAAVEAGAKTIRSGLSVVGALVDCGIPRQHAGAQWLTEKEAEEEVAEPPLEWYPELSADFNDDAAEVAPPNACRLCGFGPTDFEYCRYMLCPANKTPAAGANGSAVEDPPGGAPPPPGADSNDPRPPCVYCLGLNRGDLFVAIGDTYEAMCLDCAEANEVMEVPGPTLHGVPTFKALQDICFEYTSEHYLESYSTGQIVGCRCGLELSSRIAYAEHVAELQASALSLAIQAARNK